VVFRICWSVALGQDRFCNLFKDIIGLLKGTNYTHIILIDEYLYHRTDFKMAPSGEDVVEDALNILLNVTEKSGNLRNDLRKGILKALSNPRKEFASLKCEVEDKNKLIVDLENRVVEANSILKALQLGVDGNCRGNKEVTSVGSRLNSKAIDWSVAPADSTKKRYSDMVADRSGNVFS
jgi:hypothetical protein